MTSSPQSDPMDPVRLQLLLTGVREALGELSGRSAEAVAGPRFRRAADSPLFAGLAGTRESPVPRAVVSSPRLRPGGPVGSLLLNPTSLAEVIRRTRSAGTTGNTDSAGRP